VESQEQSERETRGAIVFGRNGTDVLLKLTEAGFVFPCVEIPRWERLAENLTAALKRDWGCDAICLFTPNSSTEDGSSNGKHYEVMECWRDGGRTGETVWRPTPSLTADSFQDEAEFRIFEQCLHQLRRYERDPSSPFAKRGWLAELRCWTAEAIRPLGLELTGPFCQYNASPSFSLIRFETNGPAVWFKAVGEPNQREFPVTLKLAKLFPRFIPEIVGTKPEWNAWLSREVEGPNLVETEDIAFWEKAATNLAELQIESISRSDLILDSGAHDLRADKLLNSVDPFLQLVAQLMEEQPKVPPATLSRHELSQLKLRIEDSLTLLEDLQIPNTLGHLDLNPLNIMISANRCVFLDWAEAYVGNPFFSFQYLLEHAKRAFGADSTAIGNLVAAYCAQWKTSASPAAVADASAFAPLLAVFVYAVGNDRWKQPEGRQQPVFARYLRSLSRRMHLEAQTLLNRGTAVLAAPQLHGNQVIGARR
jgi:phosphotransferase family enzyme